MTVLYGAAEQRAAATRALAASSSEVAETCRAMAGRFRQGGRLLVFGTGRAAADAEHVSVEFVHPVIVGKQALPALALSGDAATLSAMAGRQAPAQVFAHQIRLLGRAGDIALGISDRDDDAAVRHGLEAAGRSGLLTVALTGGPVGRPYPAPVPDHCIRAGTDDPLVIKEVQVTTYHVLWELVHVFLDRSGGPGR